MTVATADVLGETLRERRGAYVIEAAARKLADCGPWHPELRLSRLPAAGKPGVNQSFGSLKPWFDSAAAAISYAAELGRALIDQGSPLIRI